MNFFRIDKGYGSDLYYRPQKQEFEEVCIWRGLAFLKLLVVLRQAVPIIEIRTPLKYQPPFTTIHIPKKANYKLDLRTRVSQKLQI